MSKMKYFFDHASTTPTDPRVLRKMAPYFGEKFGNPASLHEAGREARAAVEMATADVVGVLNCRSDEFVFTGSATEADNLAIIGTARANRKKGNKILVSQVEHKSILAACEQLEKEGFEIIKLPVLKNGSVDLNQLEKNLDEKTILVSITAADSETGTMQPIAEIARIIKNFRQRAMSAKGQSQKVAKGTAQSEGNFGTGTLGTGTPYFHTDASQVAAHLDLNVEKLGVDLMTLSSHKIGGPKGVAGLFVRRGVSVQPIIFGGGSGLRSGTENVPGIVGFAEALRLTKLHRGKTSVKIKKLRDALERGIFKTIPKVALNGHPTKRLPNFLNISILDVEGEAMLLMLDALGIMVSTGSACDSQSLSPSAVLTALGNPYEFVHGSLRFSLDKGNTMADVKFVLKHLPEVVRKLRAISPLNLSLDQNAAISAPLAFVGNQTPHFLKNKSKN